MSLRLQERVLGFRTANELTGGDFQLQLSAKVQASFLLRFPTTVCDEDVGHLDSVFVLAVQYFQGFHSLRDRLASPDEDAVDVESKGILIGDKSVYRCRWSDIACSIVPFSESVLGHLHGSSGFVGIAWL